MGKVTGIYQCPSCAKPVAFRSMETRIFICSCGAVINRLESDDLVIKPALIIQDHNDLLRTGSKGLVQGQPFEVLGRFRLWLEESVMNYWTLLIGGNTVCLLMEGYGMYALMRSTRTEKALTAHELDGMGLTQSVVLGESDYFLQRKDACWKYEVEGEVWMPECRDQFPLFDLAATGDKHLSFIEYLPDYLVAYECKYVDLKSLQLTGLNERETTALELKCSQCMSVVRVKTFPYAQSCSCPSCGARYAFRQGGNFRNSGFDRTGKDKENKNQLAIPLGAKGVLKGIEYEVVGYALKEENSPEAFRWAEYVLYNRGEGYAFLSEYEGNWIYGRQKGNTPVLARENPTELHYRNKLYKVFNRYHIRVVDTAGEFPYDVYDDKNTQSAEFIAPPYMWISEKTRDASIEWFYGEHQDRDELLEQFPYDLPEQYGRGVLDPKGFSSMSASGLVKVTLLAIAALVAVHLLIGATKTNRVVLNKDVLLHDSASSTTLSSSKFELTKWRSNLQLDIQAPVDNSWLDLQAVLVNAGNGNEYAVEQVVEYYHGYDDGESWSEGSNRESAYLSSIPAGSYYLRIQASRDTTNGTWNSMNNFTLTVTNDVSNHRNLWIFIGVLLIWPIVQFIRMWIYERRRWEGSPFSPYRSNKS